MKATGIVRKIDDLGRIVLPVELRRVLGVSDREALEIYTDDDSIVLKKYKPGCVVCDSIDSLVRVRNTTICRSCAEIVKEALENG